MSVDPKTQTCQYALVTRTLKMLSADLIILSLCWL